MNNTELKIKTIIKNHFTELDSIDQIDETFYKNNITSLSFIKIIVALESEFDIEFDDDELDYSNFSSLQRVIQVVESKQS